VLHDARDKHLSRAAGTFAVLFPGWKAGGEERLDLLVSLFFPLPLLYTSLSNPVTSDYVAYAFSMISSIIPSLS
jgi:hypothetical protein